ncbi:hypothetical protein QM306_40435, partial [Burkholderia cenocepacia]|nr:hypothetical protein [Burkholderia cenocepacia]
MNPIRRPAATRAADVAAPARHRLVLPALCIAVLIAQIDTAIVNLATEPIGTAYARLYASITHCSALTRAPNAVPI